MKLKKATALSALLNLLASRILQVEENLSGILCEKPAGLTLNMLFTLFGNNGNVKRNFWKVVFFFC